MEYYRITPTDMQHQSYRKWPTLLHLILINIFIFSLWSCNKEKDSANEPPVISFVSDSGYIGHDTVIPAGTKVRIGITAQSGTSNLTFLQVVCEKGERITMLDSGMNCSSLRYNATIFKSAAENERWIFIVMDKDRNKDSIQIILTKSAVNQYGNILTYTNVVLGAQENTETGSFLSFSENLTFNLNAAYLNQSAADMIYYFGPFEATLSSPAEADAPTFFTGPSGLANWTVFNETRYDTTLLTAAQFDLSQNDSLLISAYEAGAGKRKAKNVVQGMVLSFSAPDGRIGLLKINEVIAGTQGTVNFTLKIQE